MFDSDRRSFPADREGGDVPLGHSLRSGFVTFPVFLSHQEMLLGRWTRLGDSGQ